MGRSPFARNNALWMSIAAALVGGVLFVFSIAANQEASWVAFYTDMVPSGGTEANWNKAVMLISGVVFATGAWYVVEQVNARRRFNRMMNSEKKSEFQQNMDTLQETVGLLPKSYEESFEEKRDKFDSRRR